MTGIPAPSSRGALVIVAAFPRELSLLSRDLRATTLTKANGILLQSASLPGSPGSILLVTAGMGRERVSLAVAAALAQAPVDILLSIGLAGACDPRLTPGNVLEATLVIDSNSGERFTPATRLLPEVAPGALVSAPEIASPAEKRRLRTTYNAAAVDMEAATVARLAHAHNIPFGAIKAISDEHDIDLTALSAFTDAHGHFRTAAFTLHTIIRPHRWRRSAALGRNSKLALETLTSAIHQLIATRPELQDSSGDC